MTDMENPSVSSGQAKSGNNFFSGFLLGVLVGAAVVFLLATKKGKKILKAISEEGGEKISSLLEKAEKAIDLDQIDEDDEEIVMPKKEIAKKIGVEERPASPRGEPKTRRFFRGISRHVN